MELKKFYCRTDLTYTRSVKKSYMSNDNCLYRILTQTYPLETPRMIRQTISRHTQGPTDNLTLTSLLTRHTKRSIPSLCIQNTAHSKHPIQFVRIS